VEGLTPNPKKVEADQVKASELYHQGLRLEKQYDYEGARRHYRQSLELRDDEEVMAAYLRVLSFIGPM
jgi:hypothetical protein